MTKKYDDEDGVWRTIGGRRIFIKNGQDLASAMKESGKFKSASKGTAKKEMTKEEKVLEDFKNSDGSKENFEKALNKISEMEYNNEINPDEYKDYISKIQKEYVEKNKKANSDRDDLKSKEDNKGEYKMYDKFEYKDGQLTAYDSYGKEVDSYGLSKEDYEENPKYWQDKFKEETNREAMNEINSSDIKLANELRKETEKKYNSLKEKQKNGYGISKEDLEDFVNNSNYQKRDELINSDKEFKKQIDGALENYNMNIEDMDRKVFEDAMGYNKEKTSGEQLTSKEEFKPELGKKLSSRSGQERISKDTKVMRYGDDYLVLKNGANKGEFKSQSAAENFAQVIASNEKFEVSELKNKAQGILPSGDIDTHEGDLYIKKTKTSEALINNMKNANSGLLSTFRDQETGETWYDIPFANMGDDFKEKTTNITMNNNIRKTSGRQEIKNASPSQIEKGDLIGPKHLLVTAIRPASVEKDGYSSGYSVTTKDSNGNTSRQIISDSARNTIYKKQTTNQSMNDTLRNAFNDYRKKHKNSNMSFTEFMRINKK